MLHQSHPLISWWQSYPLISFHLQRPCLRSQASWTLSRRVHFLCSIWPPFRTLNSLLCQSWAWVELQPHPILHRFYLLQLMEIPWLVQQFAQHQIELDSLVSSNLLSNCLVWALSHQLIRHWLQVLFHLSQNHTQYINASIEAHQWSAGSWHHLLNHFYKFQTGRIHQPSSCKSLVESRTQYLQIRIQWAKSSSQYHRKTV